MMLNHGSEKPTIRRIKSLPRALGIDLISAFITSMLVSPIVAIIDTCIIANASGKEPLKLGLKRRFGLLLSSPVEFMKHRTFFPVFCIFQITYTVSNTVESVCIAAPIAPDLPRFFSSSAVNIFLCAWKDNLFTKWYGVTTPKPVPPLSFTLFGLRDSMTVLTSFILPQRVSPFIQTHFGVSKVAADYGCQLTLPCLVQFVSTPIHLLSLDLYNRPNLSLIERSAKIRSNYWGSAVGRICRTLPGFGIGGIVNRQLRLDLNAWIKNTG